MVVPSSEIITVPGGDGHALGRRIVVNGMFGQNSIRMAFKQKLAGTMF